MGFSAMLMRKPAFALSAILVRITRLRFICDKASAGEVENTGVEPVTYCMPCKRSSQLS